MSFVNKLYIGFRAALTQDIGEEPPEHRDYKHPSLGGVDPGTRRSWWTPGFEGPTR